MNAAGDIVSADLSKSEIALGKTGAIEITVISLDLAGASSVDKVAAWGANSNAALAASALALVILEKRG